MSYSPVVPTSTIESESSVLFQQKREEKSSLPVSEAGKRVSLKEYWDHYYHHEHFAYEWNNGILEEKPMTDYDSVELYRWFLDLLQEYLRSQPIAALTMLELGVELKDSVRKPDLGVVLKSNPNPFQSGDHVYRGVCDLCIESLSISNSEGIKRDTVIKKREYAKNGVTEYFILDFRHKETYFYRLNPITGRYNKIVPKNKEIIESEVLPGFRFCLSDLKKMTSIDLLADDPVYSSYVFPKYQAEQKKREKAVLLAKQEKIRAEQEKIRAEQEWQRAEQEKKRADQERDEKEKLMRFLKEQGFKPEDLL